MADNVDITPGAGATVAADEIAGVKHQRVKVEFGGDGVATEVSAATPLPTVIYDPATGLPIAYVSVTPISITDGADVSIGATTDAAVAAGAAGSVQAKLRRISSSQLPAALGIAARSASSPVVIADINAGEYETVAASQTAQVLGATGGTGDYISGLLVTPATTSPGAVTLLDTATSITLFAGGASSVATLHPFFIPLGIYSVSGAWKVTTGANVSVIGIGNFT